MMEISIIPMTTSEDMDGKGYVHWKSWHETYTGLIDPAYMERITLEKCVDMVHRWPQNMMVAKDGDKVIGFIGYGEHRDDALTDCARGRSERSSKTGYDLCTHVFTFLS